MQHLHPLVQEPAGLPPTAVRHCPATPQLVGKRPTSPRPAVSNAGQHYNSASPEQPPQPCLLVQHRQHPLESVSLSSPSTVLPQISDLRSLLTRQVQGLVEKSLLP